MLRAVARRFVLRSFTYDIVDSAVKDARKPF
jgi:hypothetical protein